MSSEMRELVRAKIHEWRTDALEIRESDHAHRNLIAEEYEAHADELEAMLAKKPAPISGGAVITDAMVSAAYDHLCEAGVIEDAGTVAADMKVMRQALERALLARTEAGADDDKSAWCDVHKTHDQCPHTDLAVDESVRLRQLFAASQEQVRVLTEMVERGQKHHERMMKLLHPQDASGDADAAYAILDRLTTTREGCLQLAKVIYRELDKVEKLLDEAVEQCAAMQAKEAK